MSQLTKTAKESYLEVVTMGTDKTDKSSRPYVQWT